MDKNYFLNHEILGDDPLLFLAFFGFRNTKDTIKEAKDKEQTKQENEDEISKQTDKKQ